MTTPKLKKLRVILAIAVLVTTGILAFIHKGIQIRKELAPMSTLAPATTSPVSQRMTYTITLTREVATARKN